MMLSLNETHNMEGVCANIGTWAEQVFLVDSYSQDRTVDIALSNGVQVVQRAFTDFGDQWNFALSELPISTPWTMKLDPDERVTSALKEQIASAIEEDEFDGLSVTRRLWFMGRPMPVKQSLVRIWRTGSCRFTPVAVNEHPIVEGRIGDLTAELEHHDSPNLDHWLEKQNRYTTAEAIAAFEQQALAAEPRLFGSALERRMWLKKYFHRVPGRFAILFLYNYLVRGAWRAGWVGYVWARLRCDVMRYRELKRKEMELMGHSYHKLPRGAGQPDPRVQQF